MKKAFTLLFLVLAYGITSKAQTVTGPLGEQFSVRLVADKLSDPWEITYGPDNELWVTESKGYLVSKINPATGKKTLLLDLNAERQFPRYDKMGKKSGGKPSPQGGLMGMALHPQLLRDKPYVYLMYVYLFEGADKEGTGCALNYGGCRFRGRLVRYEYNKKDQKLLNPIILCDSIPQSNDHNGGRLSLAPVDGKLYLFYAIGEMGAGQFGNAGQPNHAQQKSSYEGKILRFNTEADQDQGVYDKWIPNDNPFNGQTQNAVWSTGHRNPQGLAYAIVNGVGHLYESEHGPFSDDEINLIEKGKNYGHPLIIGYADGNYDGLAASVTKHDSLPGRWHTTYPLIISEKANAKSFASDYRDPILTLYPNSKSFLTKLYEARLKGNEEQEWPSEAPSSIMVYTSSAIPGWRNSLLLPTLKGNRLIRLKLNENGDRVSGDTISYFKNKVRYRDIALSPDGKKIYLAIDSTATSSNPAKEDPEKVYHPGSIIEFSYLKTGEQEADSKKKQQANNKKNKQADNRINKEADNRTKQQSTIR
jgi:PQQ-dependent dehydrogenase (s-GDH family)